MDLITLALILAVIALIVTGTRRAPENYVLSDPTVRALLLIVVLLVLIWATLHIPDRPLFK